MQMLRTNNQRGGLPVPSLRLGFLNGIMAPEPTISRLSSASRFNSLGILETVSANVPRLDYDPITRICKGFLVEGAGTNLSIQSANITPVNGTPTANTEQWGYSGTNPLVNNTQPDPMGGTSATLFNATGGSGVFDFYKRFAGLTVGAVYTFSCFVKLGTATNFDIVVNNGAAWNTIPGARCFTGSDGLNTTTFTRVWITFTATSSVNIHIGKNGETLTAQSAGTVIFFGHQLELGSFPTSYNPTGAATATRAADVVTMPTAGWFNPLEGTILFEVMSYTASSSLARFAYSIDAGAVDKRIASNINAFDFVVTDASVNQCSISTGSSVPANTITKAVQAYKANDFVFYKDGVQVGADNAGSIPTGLTTLRLGADPTRYLNGWLRGFSYYNTRLPNSVFSRLAL